MRAITKSREPRSLARHRQSQHSSYGNCGRVEKQELRESLTQEQRGLCCYCMRYIDASSASMKIDHWKCQDTSPELQLDYGNLLGACLGGEGQPSEQQHCDTRKGNSEIKFNPANPTHSIELRIQYEINGKIMSTDKDFDTQLNEVLGLNVPVLKNHRGAVLNALVDWLREYRREHHRGPDNATLLRKRAKWLPVSGPLKPFSRVAVWWLDQRLQQNAA